MDSPYAARLTQRHNDAVDPIERAIILAEVGMYRARSGDFPAAEGIAKELRANFGDGKSARVSILLMTLEALVIYFRDLSHSAHDRMSRAQFLSVAGRSPQLIALTSAWLAHITFNLNRYGEMLRAVGAFMQTAAMADEQTICRAALTLGDAFLVAGNRTAAKAWYDKAREYAVRLGDHASIGALTYNKAALGSFVARLAALEEPLDHDSLQLLSGEVKSAINYQSVAGLQSLQSLLNNALVSIRMLESDYEGALKQIELLLSNSSRVSFSDVSVNLQCDLAHCYARTGREVEALTTAQKIAAGGIDGLAADDRALANWALGEAYDACGYPDDAAACRTKCAAALAEHRTQIDALSAGLEPYQVPDAALRASAV